MVHVIESLRRHFGDASFCPGQEALVHAALDGRDVLAVMRTGSGKSLRFSCPPCDSRRDGRCRRPSR
jgi:ATP-dependent DNA helicase RecQ